MYYSKTRNRSKLWLVLFIVVLMLASLPYFYWQFLNSPADPNGKVQAFVVKKDESTESIISRLKSEGLIRSPFAFKVYLRNSGMAAKIQAGDFKLSPAMTYGEIAQNLSSGAVDKWVTLIEGWRNEEMAERLSQELGLDKTEFLKQAKQGYMFPDTYLINKDASVADVVSILKNTFDLRYSKELQAKVRANGLTSEQGVILASIVEREARSDEVRQNVAGILLKRFKIGMGLNADATVQYVLGYQADQKSWWKKGLSLDDLQTVSPFNTYLHAGLPPSPICNPSFSSLKAVANADSSTPYLYYYHDSKGNSYYATTLEEHNANVAAHP